MPHLVDIRDLHFAYNDRPILSGLNMQFERGKVIAVMGGSGSGKSSLIRAGVVPDLPPHQHAG